MVALIVLPLVLTGLMLVVDRFVRRRRKPDAPPARAGPLLALSGLSVLTHPVLDWMNTYGVRLLMPFDSRWFYGDALFIVDPWLWLLAGAAVVLARSRSKPSVAAWALLACATTAVVTIPDLTPLAAKVTWVAGVGAIVVFRATGHARLRTREIALVCAAVLVLYIGAMIGGSHLARTDAAAFLRQRGIEAEVIAAGPLPADPFRRDVIARAGDRYYFLERSWLGGPPVRFTDDPIRVGDDGPAVQAALAAFEVRGLRNWLRFPSFEVETTPDGTTVHIRDVRYSRGPSGGLGTATVRLDGSLRPR